jgi:drug efflux transport system permease protein
MFNQRLFSLIHKEFLQIIRDPRTLMLTFAMPVVQLFLLGYAATNDVRNISLAVYDQDKSPASRALLEAYRAADYFHLDYEVGSEAEMRVLIDRGDARAGLIIPPDYAQAVAAGRKVQVAFVLDGSDPTVASAALSAATLIGQAQATNLAVEQLALRGAPGGGLEPQVQVRARVWYNPDLVSAYYMIPALIGMILQFLTTILTSTAIVRERERGTIEQLIVTPIKAWELVVGKLGPYVVVAFVDTVEIIVAGVLLFGVPINGSLPLLLALSGLFLVSTLGLGLFISTISNTQQEAMISALFTMLPTIFLSGFFFPLAAMPKALQLISYAIPLRYFLIIARSIVVKGVGAESLWREIIPLALFAVAIMGGAVARFKKRLD